MILTKHTPQIAPREEHRSTPMIPLYTRLLTPMRRNDIHLGRFRSDQTHARCLEAIHTAFPWTEIAIGEMSVRARPFLRRVDGGQKLVAGDVLVQEEGGGDADVSFGDAGSERPRTEGTQWMCVGEKLEWSSSNGHGCSW